MLNLLEKNSLKKLHLLRLLDNTDKLLSIEELSIQLNMDKRTINSLVDSIDYNIKELKIFNRVSLVKRNNFISLSKNLDFDLQVLVLFYLKQSTSFLLCSALFTEEFTSGTQFAKSNYLSLSTFKKKTESLKTILNDFDLTLTLNAKKTISGEEKQIRHFYFYFFWSSYKTTQWPFKTIDFKELKNYVYKYIQPSYSFSFSDSYKFILGLALVITRIKQGNLIVSKSMYTKVINPRIPFNDFHSVIRLILNEFAITDEDIIHSEAEFLYFSLSLLVLFPIQNYVELNIANLETDIIRNTTKAIHFWITEFCSFFSITITNSEFHYLQGNLFTLFNKFVYLKGPSANFGLLVSEKQLIDNYPYYFENMTAFIHHLNKFSYFKKINHSDHHLIDFYVLIVWKILYKSRPKLKITVQSSFSLLHMDILKEEIIRISPVPLLITQEINSETNLIISDILIPDEFSYDSVLFIWDTFPTKKQFELLRLELIKMYKERYPQMKR